MVFIFITTFTFIFACVSGCLLIELLIKSRLNQESKSLALERDHYDADHHPSLVAASLQLSSTAVVDVVCVAYAR